MRSAQILKSDTILSVLKEKILMRPSIPELRDLLLRLPLFVKPKQLRLYLVSFSATVENHLVRILMVVSVVINIGFAHIRPFNVVFTAWSYMISVENHLVGKVIVGFVLNLHSDRSIQPCILINTWIAIFKAVSRYHISERSMDFSSGTQIQSPQIPPTLYKYSHHMIDPQFFWKIEVQKSSPKKLLCFISIFSLII